MKRRRAGRRREDRLLELQQARNSASGSRGGSTRRTLALSSSDSEAGITLLYDQPVALVGVGAVAPGKRASRYVRLYVGKAIGRAARPQSLREGRNHLHRTEETAP
jgi:hypothetical protein